MTHTETPPAIMTEPITAAQRRALFAAGRTRRLTIDDIRALTPTGSISALTRGQASDLLDGLNRGTDYAHPRKRKSRKRPRRRPKGVYAIATAAQHRKIESLRIELGWNVEGLQGFLADRHFSDGRAMTKIDSTNDGRDVIELLKGVLARTADGGSHSRGHGRQPPSCGPETGTSVESLGVRSDCPRAQW